MYCEVVINKCLKKEIQLDMLVGVSYCRMELRILNVDPFL